MEPRRISFDFRTKDNLFSCKSALRLYEKHNLEKKKISFSSSSVCNLKHVGGSYTLSMLRKEKDPCRGIVKSV